MDLTQARYIVTIAEEKKLARAAEKLFVTSSALSQCIKKLEADIGAPLFEKLNSHTFQLTSAGKIYVDAARKILKIKEDAYRELEDVQHEGRGRFTFGCSPKRGLAMLTNVYPQFYKAYPHVKIDLIEAYLNRLYELVISGTVDLAVLTPISEEMEGVHLDFLDREEIVLAIPIDHPLAETFTISGKNEIHIRDLELFKNDNWMLSANDSMHRNLTNDIFHQSGIFPKKVLLETSSTAPHVAAVEEGIAVSLVPKSHYNRHSKMQILHLEPRQYRTLYAAWRKSYILSDSQKFFIGLMKEFYQTANRTDLPVYRRGW